MRPLGRSRIVIPAIALLVSAALAAATPAAGPAVSGGPAPRNDSWPQKVLLGEAGTVFVDEPQAESLDGTKLTASGTLSLQRAGESEPTPGTARYEAEIQVDRTRRTVTLASILVSNVEIAGTRPAFRERLATRIGSALARRRARLSLDDVLSSAKFAGRREGAPAKLNTQPPRIVFETEPAILVTFDGEPRFRAVEGSRLERALNTPFLVLRDPGGALYLDGGTVWFRASDPRGPWTRSDDVPAEAVRIARRDREESGVSDGEVEQAKRSPEKRVPKILVATEPTELIVSDGPPQWAPAVAGELETLANSDSDVFRTLPDGQYWVVLSGRWFRSESYSGPWTYVEAGRLPAGFRKIPGDSPRAEVLAFVPGTEPAREAVADANKPRTAAVRRSEARVAVTYDGEPRFEAVPGTRVEYALNTPEQVLRIAGRYYVCDQGVWFTSAAPAGPWEIADSIPEEEIGTIPPESPVYNTRFVSVYDSTPEVVYEAYTPAYLGSYPYGGAVVFGTGWRYRPWWGAFYYPRPWTWGFHAMYAPWAGWGFGFGWRPAWAAFRFGFGFGWGARWCGPGAFFRPAFWAAGRGARFARNVGVSRNLYASGANSARAAATRPSGGMRASAPRASAVRKAGPSASARGAKGRGKVAAPRGKARPPKGGATKVGGRKR
ncbi:MAG TPA: carbohydrate-binding family V/XII [Thermoanaerobaculia bacterium]|nr:carbohydrate-binding family V/XII [Thermoanaerobaculia bacterium]